ncbi:MAG: META domain-containing protein [Woeseia sp.]
MKGITGFAFFLLFLAGFALVNLRSVGEQKAATLAQPSAADLAAKEWRLLESTQSGLGGNRDIRLLFDEDLRLFVQGACNRYNGAYEMNDGIFSLGALAGTRRACRNEVIQVDNSLVELLSATRRLQLADRTLVLLNDAGEPLASFTGAELSEENR